MPPHSKTRRFIERETEELRAEIETLRASEAKYRRLHETRIDAFVRVSMDGRIQEVNELFQRMVGYDEEELLSLTSRDLTRSGGTRSRRKSSRRRSSREGSPSATRRNTAARTAPSSR